MAPTGTTHLWRYHPPPLQSYVFAAASIIGRPRPSAAAVVDQHIKPGAAASPCPHEYMTSYRHIDTAVALLCSDNYPMATPLPSSAKAATMAMESWTNQGTATAGNMTVALLQVWNRRVYVVSA